MAVLRSIVDVTIHLLLLSLTRWRHGFWLVAPPETLQQTRCHSQSRLTLITALKVLVCNEGSKYNTCSRRRVASQTRYMLAERKMVALKIEDSLIRSTLFASDIHYATFNLRIRRPEVPHQWLKFQNVHHTLFPTSGLVVGSIESASELTGVPL